MDRLRAYTLIELVIVLALFGIFASISVPKLTMISRFKENQELKEFKRDVLFARNQAVVNRKTYFVHLDYIGNSYFLKDESTTIKRVYFKEGTQLILNPSLSKISFARTGVPSIAGTINLKTSYNKKYYLKVRPVTGKIILTDMEWFMRNKGFSLIEVMASLALLGILSVVCLPLLTYSINSFARIKDKNEMNYIGEMVSEKLKTSREDIEAILIKLDTEGAVSYVDLDFDNNKYDCTIEKTYSSKSLIEYIVRVKNKNQETGPFVEFKASLPKK